MDLDRGGGATGSDMRLRAVVEESVPAVADGADGCERRERRGEVGAARWRDSELEKGDGGEDG